MRLSLSLFLSLALYLIVCALSLSLSSTSHGRRHWRTTNCVRAHATSDVLRFPSFPGCAVHRAWNSSTGNDGNWEEEGTPAARRCSKKDSSVIEHRAFHREELCSMEIRDLGLAKEKLLRAESSSFNPLRWDGHARGEYLAQNCNILSVLTQCGRGTRILVFQRCGRGTLFCVATLYVIYIIRCCNIIICNYTLYNIMYNI